MTGFQRLFAADLVSTFGSLMSRLAIPWLAVLVLDAGPAAMAWLAMADVIAGATASLALGALVDRWPKRATMIACDLGRFALLALIPLLWWLGALSLPWLVLVVAANGTLTIAFELAQSAWIARATAHHELGTRNAQLAAGNATVEAASFGITGWLFQWLGGIAAVAVDAASYLVSALFLRRLPEPPPLPAEEDAAALPRHALRRFVAEIAAGLRALAAAPALRVLAVLAALTSFAGGLGATSYMIFVSRDLGFSTGVLGMIFAIGGVGSIAGAALAARLERRVGAPRALVLGLLLAALGALAAPLAPGATLLGALLLCVQQVVGDAGFTAYAVQDRTLRQSQAPAATLARVDAAIRSVGHVGTLAGAVIGGLAAEAFGTRALLFAMAGLLGVAAVVAWSRLPRRATAVA